jgi:hypothetical protein
MRVQGTTYVLRVYNNGNQTNHVGELNVNTHNTYALVCFCVCLLARDRTCTSVNSHARTHARTHAHTHAEYEHELLKQLHAQATNLSFDLPKFFPTKDDASKTFAQVCVIFYK